MKRKKPKKMPSVFGTGRQVKKLQTKGYNNSQIKSRLKEQIGKILLFGNKQQKGFWPFLSVILQRYYEINSLGGKI
jgi:hypothetical protein